MSGHQISGALAAGAGVAAAVTLAAITVAFFAPRLAGDARWAAYGAATASGTLAACAALVLRHWALACAAEAAALVVIWMVYPHSADGREQPAGQPAGPDPGCPQCGGTGLVCGDHPGRPADACGCGAAGMTYTICRPNSSHECVDADSGVE